MLVPEERRESGKVPGDRLEWMESCHLQVSKFIVIIGLHAVTYTAPTTSFIFALACPILPFWFLGNFLNQKTFQFGSSVFPCLGKLQQLELPNLQSSKHLFSSWPMRVDIFHIFSSKAFDMPLFQSCTWLFCKTFVTTSNLRSYPGCMLQHGTFPKAN